MPIRKRREDLAWAAGFFDGEGYLGYSPVPTKRYRLLQMVVQQVQDGPLQRFASIVGLGKLYGPYERNYSHGASPITSWRVTRVDDVMASAWLLWPWLSEPKRQQIHEAFEAYRRKEGM